MVLVQTKQAAATAERWRRPLKRLEAHAAETGNKFDHAPIPVEGTGNAAFLFEGSQGKTCTLWNILDPATWFPWDKGSGSLKERVEKKPTKKPEKNSPDDYALVFLGEYKSWCSQSSGHAGPCSCTNVKGSEASHKDGFFQKYGLLLTTLLLATGLIVALALWKPWDADWSMPSERTERIQEKRDEKVPELKKEKEEPPPRDPVPIQVQPLVLHVAFSEDKANLTRESFDALASAAAQSFQSSRDVSIRVFALGQRETDTSIWNRRLMAVKDELVRLGVPVARIQSEGQGPYLVHIRQAPSLQPAQRGVQPEAASEGMSLDDPFANE
jgi:hypothetical protein